MTPNDGGSKRSVPRVESRRGEFRIPQAKLYVYIHVRYTYKRASLKKV